MQAQNLVLSKGNAQKEILPGSFIELYLPNPENRMYDDCNHKKVYGEFIKADDDHITLAIHLLHTHACTEEKTTHQDSYNFKNSGNIKEMSVLKSEVKYILLAGKSEKSRHRKKSWRNVGGVLSTSGVVLYLMSIVANDNAEKGLIAAAGITFSSGLIVGVAFSESGFPTSPHKRKKNKKYWTIQ